MLPSSSAKVLDQLGEEVQDMPYYEIYGKWYHLSYSHSFTEVVSARTPRAAIVKFARGLDGYEEEDDIYWELLPATVAPGQQEPEPIFWVGGDQMYKVRHVAQVRPEVVECPECHGAGKVRGYLPVDTAPGRGVRARHPSTKLRTSA